MIAACTRGQIRGARYTGAGSIATGAAVVFVGGSTTAFASNDREGSALIGASIGFTLVTLGLIELLASLVVPVTD
jgi:hypothetical protein